MVDLRLNEANSELEPVQNIQFLGLQLHLNQGRASLPVSKAREIIAHGCRISSQKILSYTRSVPFHGITQLCLRSHPTGSPVFEAPTTTFSFTMPDEPVYTTVSIRPLGPCHLTRAMARPTISHVRDTYPTFPGGVHHFHGRLYPGLGRPHGDYQIAGVWTGSERELHINVLELKAVILAL